MRGYTEVEGMASWPPLKIANKKDVLGNTGPDTLQNHKATKPAFNVGPSSARQQNAIEMVFRWWADIGPLLVVVGSYLLASTKKQKRKARFGALWQNFAGYLHDHCIDWNPSIQRLQTPPIVPCIHLWEHVLLLDTRWVNPFCITGVFNEHLLNNK